MRGTGDDVGGLYVLEIIFVGTDDRRFARAYRDHVRRGADRVGHVGKTGHFLARKSQTAVGAGIGQVHPGQFLGAENVSARLFGIDARCGILLCADEEHVHARNGTAERGAHRLLRAVERDGVGRNRIERCVEHERRREILPGMGHVECIGEGGVREVRPRVVARRYQPVGGQELVVAGGKLNRAGERRAVEIHAGERNVLHIDIVRAGFFECQDPEVPGAVDRPAACRRLGCPHDDLQVPGGRAGNIRFLFVAGASCEAGGKNRK